MDNPGFFWNIYVQDNYHFKDSNIEKNGLIFRIRIKNASRYDSQLKNPQKRSPNWTKTQMQAWHPRGPFDTWEVLSSTWQVLIGTSPIGLNLQLGPAQ